MQHSSYRKIDKTSLIRRTNLILASTFALLSDSPSIFTLVPVSDSEGWKSHRLNHDWLNGTDVLTAVQTYGSLTLRRWRQQKMNTAWRRPASSRRRLSDDSVRRPEHQRRTKEASSWWVVPSDVLRQVDADCLTTVCGGPNISDTQGDTHRSLHMLAHALPNEPTCSAHSLVPLTRLAERIWKEFTFTLFINIHSKVGGQSQQAFTQKDRWSPTPPSTIPTTTGTFTHVCQGRNESVLG